MQTYLLSALVAFAVVLVLGPIVIPMLRRLKFGQVEREEGPDSHKNKQGTPTMGGIMTLLGVLVATLIFGLESAELVLPALLVTFAFGLVGFLDDFIKVGSHATSGCAPTRRSSRSSALRCWSRSGPTVRRTSAPACTCPSPAAAGISASITSRS